MYSQKRKKNVQVSGEAVPDTEREHLSNARGEEKIQRHQFEVVPGWSVAAVNFELVGNKCFPPSLHDCTA